MRCTGSGRLTGCGASSSAHYVRPCTLRPLRHSVLHSRLQRTKRFYGMHKGFVRRGNGGGGVSEARCRGSVSEWGVPHDTYVRVADAAVRRAKRLFFRDAG